MKPLSWIIMGLLTWPALVHASASPDGDAFANSIAPTSPSQIVNPAGVQWGSGTFVPSSVPSGMGAFSTPVTDGQFYTQAQGLGLAGLGNKAMADCANYVSGSGDVYRDQQCAAVNFMANNCLSPTPEQQKILGKTHGGILPGSNCAGSYGAGKNQFGFDQQIKPDDAIFDPFNNTVATPDSSCVSKDVPVSPAQYQTQICTKTDSPRQVTCSKFLRVNCPIPPYDGCDAGGIVPNTAAGDMVVQWTPGGQGDFYLRFGSPGDNYFGDGVYDRTLQFQIADVEKITKFELTYVNFDDWLLVEINGHVVYVGPRGGDRLEVQGRFPWDRYVICNASGQSCGPAELKTSWTFTPQIDLKPYLSNGNNIIRTRLVVGGGGEEWIDITARQRCPIICDEQWEDQCGGQ